MNARPELEFLPEENPGNEKRGPVALLHCAAARAARIRALATALRLNQNYRIAGTVGAMPGLSVSHLHVEPSARLEAWLIELCHDP